MSNAKSAGKNMQHHSCPISDSAHILYVKQDVIVFVGGIWLIPCIPVFNVILNPPLPDSLKYLAPFSPDSCSHLLSYVPSHNVNGSRLSCFLPVCLRACWRSPALTCTPFTWSIVKDQLLQCVCVRETLCALKSQWKPTPSPGTTLRLIRTCIVQSCTHPCDRMTRGDREILHALHYCAGRYWVLTPVCVGVRVIQTTYSAFVSSLLCLKEHAGRMHVGVSEFNLIHQV